ncbi:MAG: hypothetical protein RL375_4436, partial [Pseudomonadota bacterium]
MARTAGLIASAALSAERPQPRRVARSAAAPGLRPAGTEGAESTRRTHLALCVVTVAALHLAALVTVFDPARLRGPGDGPRTGVRSLTVELLPASALPATPGEPRDDLQATSQQVAVEPAGSPSHRDEAPATAARPHTTPDEPSDLAAAPAGPAARVDDDVYLPRSALTKPARPLAPIEIAYPEGTPIGDFRAVLLLFVDESGKVQRVRVRDLGLPYGLERAATDAFVGSTFEPGELAGRPVKSIYAVEVS